VPLVRVEDHEQAVSSNGTTRPVGDRRSESVTRTVSTTLAIPVMRCGLTPSVMSAFCSQEQLERSPPSVKRSNVNSSASETPAKRAEQRNRGSPVDPEHSPANYPGFQPACILRLTRQALIAHAVAAVTGLPAEIMSTLFTPFVTTKSHGLGIGLTIARRIVEAHDGTIDAHENLNGGATFTVTLPRSAAPKLLRGRLGATDPP
jgi:hypothetical protein